MQVDIYGKLEDIFVPYFGSSDVRSVSSETTERQNTVGAANDASRASVPGTKSH